MKTYQVSVYVTYTQKITVQAEDTLSATVEACNIALEGIPKNVEVESINTVGLPNETRHLRRTL